MSRPVIPYMFGPPCRDEKHVFGAQRPGYYDPPPISEATVSEWLHFMRQRDITRVVCLLDESQLTFYEPDLLEQYRTFFGKENVLWSPIKDYHLSCRENLSNIMRFLDKGRMRDQKTVVHCSYGSGRTGHVLAAWLVHSRAFNPEQAMRTTESANPPRNPRETVKRGNATNEALLELLESVRPTGGGHG